MTAWLPQLAFFDVWASGADLHISCWEESCDWQDSWYTFDPAKKLSDIVDLAVAHWDENHR